MGRKSSASATRKATPSEPLRHLFGQFLRLCSEKFLGGLDRSNPGCYPFYNVSTDVGACAWPTIAAT